MEGINVLLLLVFLLIIVLIGLIRAQTLLGVFMCFIILTIIAYITIYNFTAF